MNKELSAAPDMLEKEKGISKTYMYEKIEAALVSAFKKEYGNNTNVRVHIDENKEDIKVQRVDVVEVPYVAKKSGDDGDGGTDDNGGSDTPPVINP